ncbi:hypothetical protein [Streptomyces sp. NPDC051016]|uniref:hypothetical protein n=1 Tax=Streptomyces sp. NPDC051016 TaxID=3365638 RepID=UPI0037B2008D
MAGIVGFLTSDDACRLTSRPRPGDGGRDLLMCAAGRSRRPSPVMPGGGGRTPGWGTRADPYPSATATATATATANTDRPAAR